MGTVGGLEGGGIDLKVEGVIQKCQNSVFIASLTPLCPCMTTYLCPFRSLRAHFPFGFSSLRSFTPFSLGRVLWQWLTRTEQVMDLGTTTTTVVGWVDSDLAPKKMAFSIMGMTLETIAAWPQPRRTLSSQRNVAPRELPAADLPPRLG